jgi:exoribonuclease-2
VSPSEQHHRTILEKIARRVLLERGLLPDFSPSVLLELDQLRAPASAHGDSIRDLTNLWWCSIDNDDSRDLDQLTVAEVMPGDEVKIRVAVADVDALVGDGSAIDGHARQNTTSIYTAARIFPMLPEKLSTDLTSLNPDEERMAVVVEMVIGADGCLLNSDLYRARVLNQAQLAYNGVSAWLEGGEAPESLVDEELMENLRVQDRVAQAMSAFRRLHGALSLETIEARPIFDGEQICELEERKPNRATVIIENFMIGANGVTARYLAAQGYPSIRRVVRVPKRWDRIVELARERGSNLPDSPDPKALEGFLVEQKAADPLRFPDLSLSVIKLLGQGEYIADPPEGTPPGHFGLAVKDYTHSTAPNRRYTDLLTSRLLKAALAHSAPPYSFEQLEELAQHCTEQEDAVNKAERQVGKSAAALLLESRVGETFEGIVTGASVKGTWARLLEVPVEGRVEEGAEGLDVGDRIRVELVSVNVQRGYIDFRKVRS